MLMKMPQMQTTVFRQRGMTPSEAAERCMAKLIEHEAHAPDAIRQQLKTYRLKATKVVENYCREAAYGQKMTIYNALRDAGQPELAKLIMSL